MAFTKPAVVLDNGSYNIKAGFSCDNHPVSIFRNVLGRPNYLNGSYGRELYDVKIGDEAIEKIEDLELCSPVENGQIVHWDNMERVWHHCFYRELKVAPEDRAVILGCSSKTTMEEKIQCCEVFFETLNSPGLCVQSQSVLSLYGSGCTTGISVDLGYDTTDINPVYEGGLLRYAHIQTNLASRQITDFIQTRLENRNYHFGLKTDGIIEGMKKLMYVTQFCTSSRKDYKKQYRLPDGEEVEIGEEVFMASEMLFWPEMVEMATGWKKNYVPLQRGILNAALRCDVDLRDTLLDAIIPCGAMACIPGINERISLEIEEIIGKPVNVISSPEPYTVAWLGGATFAGLPDAKKMWVSKKQYEDHGGKIVRNKFL